MPASSSAVEAVERTGGVRLDIPAKPGHVGLVRLVIGALVHHRRDLGDDRAADLVLAVSEAVGSAVEAHRHEKGDAPVVVLWSEDDTSCTVSVIDSRVALHQVNGDPDDASAEEADLGAAALRGDLSLPLIYALVDEVVVCPEDAGTAVVMTMRSGRSTLDEISL
jgi:anti-sigma regulatory factor (Ser/Thr protein kinase)